jgi:hypothetical protein
LTLCMYLYMTCQNAKATHSTKTERESGAFGASQAFNPMAKKKTSLVSAKRRKR